MIMSEPLDSDLRKIVLRLGGFYAEMTFLGCIGSFMAGSGLKEILELISAPNAVEHNYLNWQSNCTGSGRTHS